MLVYQVFRDVTSALLPLLVPLALAIRLVEWFTNNMGFLYWVLVAVIGRIIFFRILTLYATIAVWLWTAAEIALTAVMWFQQAALVAVFLATAFVNMAREEGLFYALYTLAVNWGLVGAYEAVAGAALFAAYSTKVFTLALLENPITLVIVALLALVIVFGVLYWKVRAFRDFVNKYGPFIALMIPGFQLIGLIIILIRYWGMFKDAFWTAIKFVEDHWLDLVLFLSTGGLGNILYHFWDPIVGGLNDAVNWVKGIFSSLFSWIEDRAREALDPRNWLPFGLGGLVGGKGGGFSWKSALSLIPGWGPAASLFSGFFATGGRTSHGGVAVVGERGPELVWLPGQTQVKPMSPMPDAMGFQQMPYTGPQGGGIKELSLSIPIHLDTGVIANSFAKLMLDEMARA
jgi:hypothetical protein